ncbi:hypothetical protein BYT27DRAFT_6748384 [Phlegmacium glaucopus]|nr:hypothetical protein BYT27DRAFT_6748384 [Phlegmacium glaucopus]
MHSEWVDVFFVPFFLFSLIIRVPFYRNCPTPCLSLTPFFGSAFLKIKQQKSISFALRICLACEFLSYLRRCSRSSLSFHLYLRVYPAYSPTPNPHIR